MKMRFFIKLGLKWWILGTFGGLRMGVKWLKRMNWRIGTLLNFINEKKLRLWSLCGLYFSTYSIFIIFSQSESRFSSIWPISIKTRTSSYFERLWKFWKILKGFIKDFGRFQWKFMNKHAIWVPRDFVPLTFFIQ